MEGPGTKSPVTCLCMVALVVLDIPDTVVEILANNLVRFTATCKCITAEYTLNDDGTVGVDNVCQELGLPISITGTASAVDVAYGEVGVFDVVLEGTGSVCPGPNYIVQGEWSWCSVLYPYRAVLRIDTDLVDRVRRGRLCYRPGA